MVTYLLILGLYFYGHLIDIAQRLALVEVLPSYLYLDLDEPVLPSYLDLDFDEPVLTLYSDEPVLTLYLGGPGL